MNRDRLVDNTGLLEQARGLEQAWGLLDNPLKITKKTKKTDKRRPTKGPFKGPGLLPSEVEAEGGT